jgi:hypothetical protein
MFAQSKTVRPSKTVNATADCTIQVNKVKGQLISVGGEQTGPEVRHLQLHNQQPGCFSSRQISGSKSCGAPPILAHTANRNVVMWLTAVHSGVS